MQVLMISPGMQHPQNSGVGAAAGNIANYLAEICQLKVIQSGEVSSIHSTKQRIFLEEAFSVETTIQDIVKTISNPIQVYNTTSLVEDSIVISEVQNQLASFTREVISEVSNHDFDVIYAHDWISFRAGIELK